MKDKYFNQEVTEETSSESKYEETEVEQLTFFFQAGSLVQSLFEEPVPLLIFLSKRKKKEPSTL